MNGNIGLFRRWSIRVMLSGLACFLPLAASAQSSSDRITQEALAQRGPEIHSAAAIIYNPQTGDVLWENSNKSTESLQANVQRLKEYRSKLILFPWKRDVS